MSELEAGLERPDGEATEAQAELFADSDDVAAAIDALGEEPEEPSAAAAGDEEPDTNGETETESAEAAELPSEMDLLRMRLETVEQERDHFREKHDKLSGKLGGRIQSLEREIDEVRQGGGRTDDLDGTREETRSNRPVRRTHESDEVRQELSKLKVAEAARAAQEEVAGFHQRMKLDEATFKQMQPHIERAFKAEEAAGRIDMTDPVSSRRAARMILNEALQEVVRERSEGAEERKTRRRVDLEKAKKLTEPSSVGADTVREPPAIDLENLTPEQKVNPKIRAAIERKLAKSGRRGFA